MLKRKRADIASSSSEPPSTAIERFETWLEQNNIHVSADNILIHFNESYWSIRAARDLHADDCLARIPKTSILSSKTSSMAAVIEKEHLGGSLALIAAVMHERALGSKSQWHGYLSTLPQKGEDLPLFWSEEELAALKGTEAEGRAEADLEAMEEDYEQFIKPLTRRHKRVISDLSKWQFEDFKIAASWVVSRAFFVDEYHGQSMVPVADVFNHKASIVRLKDGYQVAELAIKQQEDQGSEESEEEEAEEEEEEEEGKELMQAGQSKSWISMAREAIGSVTSWASKMIGADKGNRVSNASPLQLEIAICSVENEAAEHVGVKRGTNQIEMEGGSMLKIIAATNVKKGAEVHNTYGEYGNAELLMKYGFVLRGRGRGNPFTEVHFNVQDAVIAASALQRKYGLLWPGIQNSKSSSELKRRLKLVEDQTSIMDEEEADPIFISPNGKMSRPLLVLLIALSWPWEDLKGKSLSDELEEVLKLMESQRTQAGYVEDELSLPPFDHLVDISELIADIRPRSLSQLQQLLYIVIKKRMERYPSADIVMEGSPESKRLQMARLLRESEVAALDEALQIISSV